MGSNSAVEAGEAFVRLSVRDKEFQKALRKAQVRMKRFARDARKIGESMRAIGGGLLKFAGPIVAFGALSTKIFAGLDDSLRLVQGVTGATGQEFEKLTEKAKELGRTTSFMAQQVASAMVELARGGFDASQIDASIQSILNLSRATGTDLAEAANIGINVLNAFGFAAEDMSRVADVLTATANGSAQTLTDLFESLKTVGPVAKAAGESFEATAASLAILANAGVKGSLAGTAMRRMFLNLANTGVQKTLAEIGIAAIDTAGDLRPLSDVMAEIFDAAKELGSAERLALLSDVFGDRAVTAAINLTGVKDSFQDMLSTLRNATGTANRIAEQMDAGIGGSFRKLISAAEGVAIAFAEAISGDVQEFAASLTKTAASIGAFIKQHKSLIATFAGMVTAVTAAGVALIGLGFIANGFAVAMTVAAAAVKVYAVAMLWLAANPIGGALIAIGLLAAGIALLVKRMIFAKREAREMGDSIAKLRAANDKARAGDLDRITRLKQLQEKTKLNNEEMDEARDLIGDLTDKYGDLGVSIDGTTGKITGLTKAQGKLNDRMREAKITEIVAELGEVGFNIRESQKQIDTESDTGFLASFGRLFTSDETEASTFDKILRERTSQQARRKVLEAQLALLRGGDTSRGALTGDSTESESIRQRIAAADIVDKQLEAKLIRELADAEERLGDIREDNAAANRTALQNELLEIRKIADEEKSLLNLIIDAEKQKGDAGAERVKQLERELKLVDQQAEARSNVLLDKNLGEALGRGDSFNADLRRQFELAFIDLRFEGTERERKLIELDRDEQLKEARKIGGNENLVRQLAALRIQALDPVEKKKDAVSTAGAFSAAALRGLGAVSETKRMAKGIEKLVDDNDDIKRNLKKAANNKLAFS